MFDKILPVLKEMWFTSPSMKDLQTYIEANFPICKTIEGEYHNPTNPIAFIFPMLGIYLFRGEGEMYFTCQVVKYPIISESELSNLRMFTLPSVFWANKMQSSLPVLWGGVRHAQSFKSSCLFWLGIWDPGTQIIKLDLFPFILCQQQTAHSSVVAYIHI